MIDALHPDHIARPPRHVPEGDVCVVALITEQCPRNHDYAEPEMTPTEQRLVELEVMVEEVAALYRDSKYLTLQVDEVARYEDGRLRTIFGTKVEWIHEDGAAYQQWDQHPYIIGRV